MPLRPNWQETALANYRDGASDTEVTAALKIPYKEFLEQLENNPEFLTIVEHGRDLAKAFWYRVGRENVKNNKFNTTLWSINMKNRYNWSDKVTTEDKTRPVKELTDDQLEAELNKKLKEITDKAPNVVKLRSR